MTDIPRGTPIEQTVAVISESVASLAKSVETLTDHLSVQIVRTRAISTKTRRLAIIAIIGLALDVMLTVGTLFIIQRVRDNARAVAVIQEARRAGAARNNARLEAQQKSIARLQTQMSTGVLCPLYDIFLKSYDPHSPSALANPSRYEESFRVIRSGSKVLGCKNNSGK